MSGNRLSRVPTELPAPSSRSQQQRSDRVHKGRHCQAIRLNSDLGFMSWRSVRAGLELWEREFGRDFFALAPVVISVALEAAGSGVVGAGGMAGLAGGDARQKHV